MPAPSSFIDIDTIPFTRVVTQAEFNVANEIWFRYISASPDVIGLQTNSGGTFVPKTLITDSVGTTIRPNVTGTFGNWFQIGIGTYYIKVTRNGGGASNFDFTFTANLAGLDADAVADGDIIVNDDQNRAATLFDSSLTLKTYLSTVPGGEFGAIIPGGISVWHDFYGKYSTTNRIAVLNASLNYIGSVACGLLGILAPKFAVDVTNSRIYVINQLDQLWYIDSAGNATNAGYTFAETPQIFAINEDGTKLYWAERTNSDGIHVLVLADFSDDPDIYTIPAFATGVDKIGVTPNSHSGDMFVTSDGKIVFWWYDDSLLTYKLTTVSNAGALIHSESYAFPDQIDHLAYIDGDNNHLLIWLYTTSLLDTGRFGRVNLTTGVIDNDVTFELFEDGVNMIGTEKFGPSTSCTFLQVSNAAPPEPTGTIIIQKVTNPSGLTQQFDFTTSGGLVPSTFSLNGDGDSRTYLSVPVGTYGITETPISGYVTTYDVSNDDPHTAINVGDGDVITVTVTNSLSISGGIYKIDPAAHKRNDSIYASDGQINTTKIPNPFGITGYIGD